ncbi:MAG: GNAT family N-acetyltransferase [Vagococcus sp.]|uniref:GNAT family N-acetyltransferase n=1 Tax=Vagococcus sp. TaxID=1933889 RepID=UPI002FCA1F5E
MFKTDRLYFEEITIESFNDLKTILQDETLMLLGWGKIYSDNDVTQWIKKITAQYKSHGYSYWLVKKRETNQTVGIMGLIPTTIENTPYNEVAYIVKKEFQGQGLAIEGMIGLKEYAFSQFNLTSFIAQFVPENISSEKIAQKLGMTYQFSYVRDINGENRKHLVYGISKKETE